MLRITNIYPLIILIGDVVIIDTKLNTNRLNMAIFVVTAVDSEGRSNVVSLSFLSSESQVQVHKDVDASAFLISEFYAVFLGTEGNERLLARLRVGKCHIF